MTVSFVEGTAGTLFNRLGKMGVPVDSARTEFRDGGDWQTDIGAISDRLAGGDITPSGDVQDERDLLSILTPVEQLEALEFSARRGQELRRLARRILRRHIWRDTGQYERDGDDVATMVLDLLELRRQMVAAGETFPSSTVSSTVSTPLTNVGNGTLLVSHKRGDGLATELQHVETLIIRCVRDGYTRLGLQNWEEWRSYGAQKVDPMHPDWRGSNRGSGLGAHFQVGDPTADADRGNMLVNGFEDFDTSTGIPRGWSKTVGVFNTDFRHSSAQAYFGSNSLELMAGGGALTSFQQSFDDIVSSYSTAARPQGSNQYGLFLRYLCPSGTVTAGTLRLAWRDSAGTILNDDQSVANSTTLDLTTATTSWQTKSVALRTPKSLGTGSMIRADLTAALTGANVFLDSLCLIPMTELYPGGPWVALAAGSTPFISDPAGADYFSIASTNNYAGATHARKHWLTWMDALFDLALHKVLFPTGAGSIANSAIA